ncbi:hypothetical protein MRB53_006136 [Persea americana]|uniref:Uncharacterized protein n=1 Tax=Persea americana TaxID=3435 RepID=A0ACC2MFU8_PERAE|nr:hypothetical protein MRB53_006136 [Persea americana]
MSDGDGDRHQVVDSEVFMRFGQVDSWIEDDEGRARLIQMGSCKGRHVICGNLDIINKQPRLEDLILLLQSVVVAN